jgi:hypothetical protein
MMVALPVSIAGFQFQLLVNFPTEGISNRSTGKTANGERAQHAKWA